jgi:(E)-4-hydroxy-3-methylbut-2-enyl-diphosphate synthase
MHHACLRRPLNPLPKPRKIVKFLFVMMKRRKSTAVRVGKVTIGGDAPISVQSMTCTKTGDIAATVAQIRALTEAGCEIVRVAVPDAEAAAAIGRIREQISIPLVADIHFDYRLALDAIRNGADKIRINPGNIGSEDRVASVLNAAGEKGIPIRIGVNAGSLEKEILTRFNGVTAEALVESAMGHVAICERMGFRDLVIAIKASNIPMTVDANRLLARSCGYPIHLGVTESGTLKTGAIRSAVGIGTLLAEGIGDTVRVSLTADPVDEIRAGWEILKSLGLRRRGLTIVSCPTCGRLQTDMIPIVEAVEKALAGVEKPLTLAIMGCAVNGPGEAREADIGIACGKGEALLFRRGQTVRKVAEGDIVKTLIEEVEKWNG